jgi:uncharacterized membrane protein YhaH (DUF805 family)
MWSLMSLSYLLAFPVDEAIDYPTLTATVIILNAVVWFLLALFQVIKRLHDFDRPWWHVLTLLIPFWMIYELGKLIFFEGAKGPNWLGKMTPQHSSTLRRNSWLLAGAVFVISTIIANVGTTT